MSESRVRVLDDDLFCVKLNDLDPNYKSLDTSILSRRHMLEFEDLPSLCLQQNDNLGKSFLSTLGRNSRD